MTQTCKYCIYFMYCNISRNNYNYNYNNCVVIVVVIAISYINMLRHVCITVIFHFIITVFRFDYNKHDSTNHAIIINIHLAIII